MKMTAQPVASGKNATPRARVFTRFRRLALPALFALAMVACVAVWRMRSLDGLPDVGDPFDVALALRPILISDEDDSFVSYIAASRMLTPFTTAIDRAMRKSSTWSTADQKL